MRLVGLVIVFIVVLIPSVTFAASDDHTPVTIGLVEFIAGLMAAVIAICVFLFDQFRRAKEGAARELKQFKAEMYRVVSRHKKEDDENFGKINDNIHEIHIRNARIDRTDAPPFKTLHRRRYLVDDGGDLKHGDDDYDEASA